MMVDRRSQGAVLLMSLALLALAPVHAAGADAPVGSADRDNSPGQEKKRVLAAADRFFAAMRTRDLDGVAASLIPTGSLFFQRRNPDGRYSLHHKKNADWLSDFRDWNGQMDDTPSNSKVQIWGPIATISQDFVFHRNGKFSHCGVNLIQLVKDGPDWRIANIVWTEEKSGCAGRG